MKIKDSKGKLAKKEKELVFLLEYLKGYEEESTGNPGKKTFRSRKGYPFEILNEFEEREFIAFHPDGTSIIFTEAGKKKGEELKKKYLGKS
ncbi:MAG TPA: DUF6429 family protein [Dehalococcoidia bacterium]|nr:DUF6429 family protein [Dehalococcoidia bacterium]